MHIHTYTHAMEDLSEYPYISGNSQITPGTLKIPSFLLFLNLFPPIAWNSFYPNYLIGMLKNSAPRIDQLLHGTL